MIVLMNICWYEYELERDDIDVEKDDRIAIVEGNYDRLIAELERQRDSKTSEIRKEYIDIYNEIDENINELLLL